MHIRSRKSLAGRVALAIAGSMFAATSVFAHATLDRPEAPADSFYKAVFGIGHGCDGQPTLRIRVRIPEGITSVKPQPKAGWELTVRREKLPQPTAGTHGGTVTEVVTEVMWSGKLPDDNFDEFLIQVRLPNKPGQTLYFPTLQECETAVERWIEIPAAGKHRRDYSHPAPSVTLTPKRN